MALVNNTKETSVFLAAAPSFRSDDAELAESLWMTELPALSALLVTALLTFIYWSSLPAPLPGIPYTRKSLWNPFGDAFDFVQYTKDVVAAHEGV